MDSFVVIGFLGDEHVAKIQLPRRSDQVLVLVLDTTDLCGAHHTSRSKKAIQRWGISKLRNVPNPQLMYIAKTLFLVRHIYTRVKQEVMESHNASPLLGWILKNTKPAMDSQITYSQIIVFLNFGRWLKQYKQKLYLE